MNEKKEYKMNLSKQYEVEFIKDGAVYKAGDKVMVNMALASKFFKQGKIRVPNSMREDAKELGCDDLFGKVDKTKKED